jgi:hypothetical protein
MWSLASMWSLELAERKPDLALFNMAVDSKLRGYYLVHLLVSDAHVDGLGQEDPVQCSGTDVVYR